MPYPTYMPTGDLDFEGEDINCESAPNRELFSKHEPSMGDANQKMHHALIVIRD